MFCDIYLVMSRVTQIKRVRKITAVYEHIHINAIKKGFVVVETNIHISFNVDKTYRGKTDQTGSARWSVVLFSALLR